MADGDCCCGAVLLRGGDELHQLYGRDQWDNSGILACDARAAAVAGCFRFQVSGSKFHRAVVPGGGDYWGAGVQYLQLPA